MKNIHGVVSDFTQTRTISANGSIAVAEASLFASDEAPKNIPEVSYNILTQAGGQSGRGLTEKTEEGAADSCSRYSSILPHFFQAEIGLPYSDIGSICFFINVWRKGVIRNPHHYLDICSYNWQNFLHCLY